MAEMLQRVSQVPLQLRRLSALYEDPRWKRYVGQRALLGGLAGAIVAWGAPRLTLCVICGSISALGTAFLVATSLLEPDQASGKLPVLPRELNGNGQWTVMTESFGTPNVCTFQSKEAAELYFEEVASWMPRVLVNPQQDEVRAEGGSVSAWEAAKQERREAELQAIKVKPKQAEGMVSGKWMVVVEDKPYKVSFWEFDDQSPAVAYFQSFRFGTPRILYDREGNELQCAGSNRFGLDTIRGRTSNQEKGMVSGKWMVLTEEAPREVTYHAFEDEEKAGRFFSNFSVGKARMMFDPEGREVQAGGINMLARRTLRKCARAKVE